MTYFTLYKASTLFFTFVSFARLTGAFRGDATFYNTGVGSCGARSVDADYVVALSSQERVGGHCYQHISITYQGRNIDATVVDTCPGCSQYSIDLSPAAFSALAPLNAGRIQVDWHYV
ncbi:hypothetical protein CPC08DRAFT_706368 [Agrocybe pediades]|nr:hypothetical protein CPC08DRAFT_706368 [Agrocybe pediades]